MGKDKAFLDLAGKPLIEHVMNTLQSVFGSIIIVTNTPQRFAAYDAVVVTDVFSKRGPLTGIYSGMRSSSSEYNFVVACDMPYLNRDLITYMAGLAEGYDAVVPAPGDFLEPLHAIYCRALLPLMERQIEQGNQRIRKIFPDLRIRYIRESEIDRFDPGRKSFKNLNTPQEYEEAACADWECRN